jgi:hypothetical protein
VYDSAGAKEVHKLSIHGFISLTLHSEMLTLYFLSYSNPDELVETVMHQLVQDSCEGKDSADASSVKSLCFENDPPGRDCLREVKVFPGGPVYCQNEDTKEWALAGLAPSASHPKCGIQKARVSSIGGSTEWILKTIEALTNSS